MQPKPLEAAEKYRFNLCIQSKGETVADYLANLRRSAKVAGGTRADV